MRSICFSWDIKSEKEKDYMDFIFNEYLPSMTRMGITVTDGWYKMAGEGPQIMAMGEGENSTSVSRTMESREFHSLELRLLDYVENYSKQMIKSDVPRQGRF